MKIENLRSETKDGWKRVIATVTWENCNLPKRDIYFEGDHVLAGSLSSNPNAFLVACIPPAMYHGEKRVFIDGEICPFLRENQLVNMGWLSSWYGGNYKPVVIEARIRNSERSVTNGPRNTALFLSGGVDSLFTLRQNRTDFPVSHPASIKDAFLVHGFDIQPHEDSEHSYETFRRATEALRRIARDANINLIPVRTNVRHLHSKGDFWMQWSFGSALASVAHAFSDRISHVFIASDFPIRHVIPWGSHPILISGCCSFDLGCSLHGSRYSRLEKIKLIANWDAGLANLRVCLTNPPDKLNCGRCEKCLRTMLALFIIGKLKDAACFADNEISADMFQHMKIRADNTLSYYNEFIGYLKVMKRHDLIQAIKGRFHEYQKFKTWKAETDWKGFVKRIDRKILGGNLSRFSVSARKHA